MKTRNLITIAGALTAVALAVAAGWWVGMNQGMKMAVVAEPAARTATGQPQKAGDVDPANGRKVLYWHDPMVPNQKFDRPGKSPFMDMMLVPKYADGETGDDGRVVVSPRVQQSLGVRTAEVTRGNFATAVEVNGSIGYNERDVSVVASRVAGVIEKLYIRAPLDTVRKGQVVAELFVPEWLAAQEEYLSVRQLQGGRLPELIAAARQRMVVSGVPDDMVRIVEQTGRLQRRVVLVAPTGGIVGELNAREGTAVMAGAALMRINGLSSVWVNADVPENMAARIRPGAAVEARAPALPDATFSGRVGALLPELNPTTRTIRARIELTNPRGALLPGMFVSLRFPAGGATAALQVPTEAVIQTGQRSLVMVAQDGGTFRPVEVEVGAEANGFTEIRKGLTAGQKVVVSGQFLLDSESSVTAATSRLAAARASSSGEQPSGATTNDRVIHHGEGRIESLDKSELMLSHGPIPSLKWGEMTMGFKLPADASRLKLSVGDRVTFDFVSSGNGEYQITAIRLAAPGDGPPGKGAPK